jgi:hypothetical protein
MVNDPTLRHPNALGLLAGCNNHHHPGEEMMADEQVVQVSRLLDERGMSFFQIKLLVWSMFVVLIDGYDIGAISFAAPALVKSFGVAPGALGPVFSASLVGILFRVRGLWLGRRSFRQKGGADQLDALVRGFHLVGRLRD